MKLAEKILAVLSVAGIILSLMQVPGGSILMILSMSLLSSTYMYFGFALFNGIRLRKIFKKESYKGISAGRIVGAILLGMTLVLLIISAQFKIQSWPGFSVSFFLGITGALIALIVGIIRNSKSKAPFYKWCIYSDIYC